MLVYLKHVYKIRLLLTVGLIALISGCRILQPQIVQHTIENESSVNTETEYWVEPGMILYPVESYGIETRPLVQGIIPGGITRGDLETLPESFNLVDITVSDTEIIVSQDSMVSTFKLPVKGESLSIRAQEETVKGWLLGEPEDVTFDVSVPRTKSLFEEIRETLKWLILLVLLGLLGFAGFILYKAKKAKMVTKGVTDVATRTLTALTQKWPKR